MTAHRDDSACTGAVVRKPSVKERAGDEAPTVTRGLWGFDRGAGGGRKARQRAGEVKAGAGGSRLSSAAMSMAFETDCAVEPR
jgi:hypothetical protein